jgi:Tfp pilus assembly protein PilV
MRSRRRQRGLSLIESLISFAVAAIGMMALVVTESRLRLGAELARQRTEAARLAHAELERLRAFASVDALHASPPRSSNPAATDGANAGFVLERQLDAAAAALVSDVSVQWNDRQGKPARVSLHGIVAGLDPALSGYLVTQRTDGTGHLPRGRSLAIPPQAVDLGDGRSAFTPPGAAGIRWIFDNRSGLVSSVCAMPAAAVRPDDGNRCLSARGLVISGHVRFSTGDTVTADDAEHPRSAALDLDLQLSTGDGSATCFDDARAGGGSVSFHCLVTLAPGRTQWSGRLDVVPLGWTTGTQAGQYRICRYSADQDGRDGISNAEHPLDYRQVSTPLMHQNFLVVRGPNSCPSDAARGPFIDRNTVEQAPQPAASPRG